MATLRYTPDSLLDLSDRMASASASLQYDTQEIQQLLSQFNEAISGDHNTQSILVNAEDGMIHCNQLCQELEEASRYLHNLYESYLEAEETLAATMLKADIFK